MHIEKDAQVFCVVGEICSDGEGFPTFVGVLNLQHEYVAIMEFN